MGQVKASKQKSSVQGKKALKGKELAKKARGGGLGAPTYGGPIHPTELAGVFSDAGTA